MAYDASFKDMFGSLLREKNFKCRTSVEVGKLPLQIDIVLERNQNSDFSIIRPLETVMKNMNANRLIVEFKSMRDQLKLEHIRKLIAYKQLFLILEDLNDNAGTAMLIFCVSTPRTILQNMDVKEERMGLYKLKFERNLIYIVVANEVPIMKSTLGIATFASSFTQLRKLVPYISRHPHAQRFLSFSIVMNYKRTLKVMREAGMSTSSIIMRNIKLAINDLGLENVIKEIGLENVIEQVGLENVIEQVGLENVIRQVGKEKTFKILLADREELPQIIQKLSDEERDLLRNLLDVKSK